MILSALAPYVVPVLLGAAVSLSGGSEMKRTPTVHERTAGAETKAGLLTVHLNQREGTIWLEVPPAADPREGHQFLYVEGLVEGLGSNPVGLDRGRIGPARLVAVRVVGGRVLVEQVNLRFRVLSDDPDEQLAVRESFARSVLWGGPVAARNPDGTVLVDFTSFVVRDAHDSIRTLEQTGQGKFRLDPERSAPDLDRCLVFPENVEFESILTFTSDAPGPEVLRTAPAAGTVTLIQHQSFLRLPDDGYRPRRHDVRGGSFAVSFQDYAAPLDRPVETRWIVRHRLEKTDPRAARSKVKRPIVYYVDRGAPEPIRSALIEGASWWAQAFEAAGFEDAFRVELLPEGVHPLDARYNVIEWVHRETRGWSYGGGVIDPRTGEMIKGHVRLGSLRVRQDRMMFQGLAGVAKMGSGAPDDPVQLALARIRQLSAHEVGHALGLEHNFAASTYGRASVMDYPAPLVSVARDGSLDFSQAYAVGAGAWDEQVIRFAYSQFLPGADEAAELEKILREGVERGLIFLSERDARPEDTANPRASLWDNGEDPVAMLRQTLDVRRVALQHFGEGMVPPGTPRSELQEVLVPVYLYHRYQLEAAAKVIGGLEYTHAVAGDGQPGARLVSPAAQREALETILGILDPAVLDLPEAVLAQLLPMPPGHAGGERLAGWTDPAFDPMAAASTAARMVVDVLLQRQRAARLVDHRRRDATQPGLEAVLDALVARAFDAHPSDPRRAGLAEVIQGAVVEGLLALSSDEQATPIVRAKVDGSLRALHARLISAGDAWGRHLASEVGRHLNRPAPPAPPRRAIPDPPPGSPIGQ